MNKLLVAILFLPLYLLSLNLLEILPESISDDSSFIRSDKIGYSLGYSTKYNIALWTIYKTHELPENYNRPLKFIVDKELSKVTPNDYKNTGFNKGHLVPSRDMSYDSIAMTNSYMMSNITPQDPKFNSGIWSSLESHIRVLSMTMDLVIITGPVISSRDMTISKKKILVPDFYYKIIYDYNSNVVLNCYLIPNRSCQGKFSDYEVSYKFIELITNIKFNLK